MTTQYALYHIPSKQYVYHHDECGDGFNGDTPYLISNVNYWNIEDDVIYLEDGEYPSTDFEIHEYTCEINKVVSLISYITKASLKQSTTSPTPTKSSMFNDEQLMVIDDIMDSNIKDIIKSQPTDISKLDM